MPSRWWQGLTRYQWIVLAVAWLGWVFDIADTALFNFARVPMLKEMLGGEAAYKTLGPVIEGRLITVFMLGWALGGLVFGMLADKWGRTRTMALTILLYALFTGLTAACHTWEQVAAVRFLTALGIGGEWAAGAALVAEVFPDKARAGAAALLQSAAAVGPVLAALCNLGIAPQDWRWLFLIGVLPASLTVLVRFSVKEPERWQRAPSEARGNLRELLTDRVWRKHALVALVLGTVGIAGATNVSYWLPNLVKSVSSGLADKAVSDRTSYAFLVLNVGTLIGVFLMPWVCERLGRRPALALFLVLSPISVLAATYAGGTWERLLLVAPLMSLFSIGISAGFVLYFPELFPTRLRATGAGIAYNVSRVFAAGVPLLTAMWMGSQFSVGKGVAATALVLGLGVLVLPFATETRGKPLEA